MYYAIVVVPAALEAPTALLQQSRSTQGTTDGE